jgi:hypothetical protein
MAEAMADRIRIIRHEAVPGCGSFEARVPDDRPSEYPIRATFPPAGWGRFSCEVAYRYAQEWRGMQSCLPGYNYLKPKFVL